MAKGVKGSGPSEQNRPIKTSIVVHPETMRKIRYICFKENKEISTLAAEGFQEVIKRFEKKHGEITG